MISYHASRTEKVKFCQNRFIQNIQSMVTSFYVCRPGDQLVKLLSGEESGKNERFKQLANFTFTQTCTENQ